MATAAHIILDIKSRIIRSKFRDVSAAEIWSPLCICFGKTNGFLALWARNQPSSCKYIDRHDLQSHLDNMSELWGDAVAAGVEIGDEKFCHIL